MEIAPGCRVSGRYSIRNRLGAGGAGTVYRARDQKLHHDVTLKFLHPERTAHPEARRRFVPKPSSLQFSIRRASPAYTTSAKPTRAMSTS
jgi:serine/threonine protein kinase